MKFAIILISFVLAVSATNDADLFAEFKKNHGKTYKNLREESIRFSIFQSNLKVIESHNARYERFEESYFLKINQFADLTDEEFKYIYLNYEKPEIEHGQIFTLPEGVDIPDAIDWREKGAVLKVKDQGQCGSCWAFSTTGALEGQNILKHNVKISLSEEQLVDCSKTNHGCQGGHMIKAYQYIQEHGISTEESYPYTAGKTQDAGVCKSGENSGIKVTGFVTINSTESALKEAVGTVGPIAIGVDANSFKFYGGGLFNYHSCGKKLNHGVLAVGYGSESSGEFWIVKNSWGTVWGENGYIRMARNQQQQCGISLDNTYPLIE